MSNSTLLFYSGGSGGFLALHGLILSGAYCADKYNDFDIMAESGPINNQWNEISYNTQWKDSERWPDNNKTKLLDCESKLYFECNPLTVSHYKSNKILVYTNAILQIELMKMKRSNLAHDKYLGLDLDSAALNEINAEWNAFYNNVRDISWPICNTLYGFKKLPLYIQKEIRSVHMPEYQKTLDIISLYPSMPPSTVEYLEFTADRYKNEADYSFDLCDLIKTKFNVLTDTLNIPHTDEHDKLASTWLSLHPAKIQQLIIK